MALGLEPELLHQTKPTWGRAESSGASPSLGGLSQLNTPKQMGLGMNSTGRARYQKKKGDGSSLEFGNNWGKQMEWVPSNIITAMLKVTGMVVVISENVTCS